MDNLVEIETRLWDYIDGACNTTEILAVEKLIAENMEWRAKYDELLEIHHAINATELEQPSLRFTKNVMEEISKYNISPATKAYINKNIIWSIAIFFFTIIGGSLIYCFGQIEWTTTNNTKIPIDISLSSVDYSSLFNNTYMNLFMMLNIVLGLMLLDRYLTNKKNDIIEKV